MTEEEWRAFVLTGTRTGKLATNRKDGRPHVTPVWFLIDEGGEDGDGCEAGGAEGRADAPRIVFTTWHESLKCKSLLREPRFSLCVDDQTPPFSYVMLECTAEFTEDPVELRTWATRIGSRYMGPENGAAYGERNSVPGEYLVRARVDRVVAFGGIAD
ncbi:PPOX class F420-dependent oxidoreductase [Streptomyces sp. NPDC021093]|uniref:PPOX class F420-dependent oxidoreductase n=1 Tax=Streptomyces sp. NPDC021093 TaxID=3365112 RepID=UPI00379FCCC6